MSRWAELEAAVATRLSGERLAHVHRVVETARELGNRYGADLTATEEAALLHDYAKAISRRELLAEATGRNLVSDPAEELNPQLLHGPVAAAMLQEAGLVTDPDVLNAIRWHTTGRVGMSTLEKVIWLADYIEPGREFPGVNEIRTAAAADLDRALLMAMESTILFVVKRRWPLHLYTVMARNWLLSVVK